MNKLLKHLEKDTAHIRLSDAEKSAIRMRLREAMDASAPVRATHSPYVSWFFAPRSFAFALVLVVLTGSGTAFAAEGALPGDVLYPVKIHINEPVETALALTPQAKLAVNTKFAERRIAEVQALAARGTLDATTTAQAEQNFDYHTVQVASLTQKGKDSRKDRVVFSTKIHASLGVENTSSSTGSARAALPATGETEKDMPRVQPAEQSAQESPDENADHFTQHVRASVQTILDLEASDKLHIQDNLPGIGGD